MNMPNEKEQERLQLEVEARRDAELKEKDPHPYLTELGHCFTIGLTEDKAYWWLRCIDKSCERNKKGWKIRRQFLTGYQADISKGDFNSMMAHARAPHGE